MQWWSAGPRAWSGTPWKAWSQVLEESLLENPVVMFSGPSPRGGGIPWGSHHGGGGFYRSRGGPARCRTSSQLLPCGSMSTTTSWGSELGGALKNVIALAGGNRRRLKLGDNTKAALMTRGSPRLPDWGWPAAPGPRLSAAYPAWGFDCHLPASVHSRNRRPASSSGPVGSPKGRWARWI